jgi:hypothetical protein
MNASPSEAVMRVRSCALRARDGRPRPADALITMSLVLFGLSTLKLR